MRTHYCLTSKSYLLAMCFVLIVSCFAEAQLADKYRRNGEVYFLVGEQSKNGQPNPLKGIYRMNNPETQASYPVGGYRYISKIDNTTGFVVTLDRDIYTFTKTIDENAKNFIYRQVLDNVDYKKSDYGYHSYWHYDHRPSGGGYYNDIYRPTYGGRSSSGTTNSRGRTRYNITSVGTRFYALAPDAEAPGMTWAQVQAECPGYIYKTLSERGNNIKLGIYNNSNTEMTGHGAGEALWYKLDKRNFTSPAVWFTGRKKSSSGNCFATYGDTEDYTKNDYKLCTWKSNNVASNESNPTYNKQPGEVLLGSTGGISVGRRIYAGCLDGCDGFSGSADPVDAPVASASVAFQPKPKNSSTGDRSYFYSRVITDTNYTLTKTPSNLAPTMVPSDQDYLANKTTYRIGVSIKDKDHDYLYALGDDVIKKWYDDYNAPSQLSGHKIKSVSVSNQWEQKGGIVFAYDSNKGYVYEFVRNEEASDPKAKIEKYRALKVQSLRDDLNLGDSENELDDLAADGYGNLYYTVSQPSGDPATYNPIDNFKHTDAVHVHKNYENTEGIVYGDAIFVQEFRKTIGKYDIQTESVSEINRLVYAAKVYSIPFAVPSDCYSQFKDNPSGWLTTINNYQKYQPNTCTVGSNGPKGTTLDTGWFAQNSGCCDCATITQSMALDYNNPGQTQLSVVNVPTPPEVKHLGPYKVSYLDICGPYTSYPIPSLSGTGQHPADISYTALANRTLYFFMVENYPYQAGTHSQDPKGHIDYDEDKRGSGFISTIKYPDKPYTGTTPSGITYEWKLWQVQKKVGDNDVNTCELVSENSGNSSAYGFWYFSKGKFILCCRARYTWYNYDKLEFGTTVDDRETCKEDSWAWASKANSQVAFDQYKNTGACDTSLCQNATSTDRLTEIMNLPEFSFMKNNPKDLDGNTIKYRERILGAGNDPSNEKDIENYWSMQPIVCNGNWDEPKPKFRAEVERCDEIVKKNSPSPDPNTYIYNTGANSYWSKPLGDDNSFVLDCGKKYFWRMSLASQTKLFTDISKTTKIDPGKIDDDDFNMIAYLVSSPILPDGSPNNTGMYNSDANLRFDPTEAGSCWWYENIDSEGNPHNEIKAFIGIEYKLPGQSNTESKILIDNLTYDLNLDDGLVDSKGRLGLKLKGSGGLWNQFKPIIASIAVDLPVTDPLLATISVTLQRQFQYRVHVLNDGMVIMHQDIGPIPYSLTGEASIRVIDTKEPEIVYADTPNVNLFGITGRPLEEGQGVGKYSNPKYVSFTIKDNNAWEAGSENGIGLVEHVQNYAYNYGSAACASYTAGSEKLSEIFKNVSYQEGIKKEIEDLMEQGKKTSHKNYKKIFSKSAVDTRFIFDSAGYYKNSTNPFKGGAVFVDKADSLKYTFSGSDPNSGQYVKYNETNPAEKPYLFYTDDSLYAFHRFDGTDTSRYLERLTPSYYTDTIGGVVQKTSKSVYRILLTNIKMKNLQNMVPENYANNTPGYEPYHFYIRSTDCSGNYTYVPGDENKLKKEQYLPLNIALHVKDDIPPIAFGRMVDTKNNNTMSFPQVATSLGSESCPLDLNANNIASVTHIPSAGGTGVPEFFGMTLDNEFLRAQNWYSADNDGNVVGSNGTYKTLLSFSPNNITLNTNMVIAHGQTVTNNNVFVAQLNNQVTPYYVEDNTLCNFFVNSMDNAGMASTTLFFMYYKNGLNQDNGLGYGIASQSFTPYGTNDINGNLASRTASVGGLFRGPEYPMSIPILIVSEDDAKEWDYYDGIVTKPNDISKPGNLFGQLIKGGDSANNRYISTSLAVFKSGLDIKTLEKSLKNN